MVSETLDIEDIKSLEKLIDSTRQPPTELKVVEVNKTHLLVYNSSKLKEQKWMYSTWSQY